MTDHDAIFLGDILSTGYFCAENGGIRPGDNVAVFGAGPVGLLAMQSAPALRADAALRGRSRRLSAEAGRGVRRRAKDLTLEMGICNARNYMAPLLPLVRVGKLRPSRIITHTMGLGEAPKGYAIFDRKEDRAIKVMLKP